MATQSIILSWKIPWTKEPGGLQSIGFHGSATTRSEKRLGQILKAGMPSKAHVTFEVSVQTNSSVFLEEDWTLSQTGRFRRI